VAEKGKTLVNFIDQELVAGISRTAGLGPKTHGISIYLPEGAFFNDSYDALSWAKATRWASFARWAQPL
jgi:hypothetical protein